MYLYYDPKVIKKIQLAKLDYIIYSYGIRYVFRSAYLRNGIDKLFGYQSYLSAILAVRLTTHRLGVISLALLPIVWRNKIHTALPLGD